MPENNDVPDLEHSFLIQLNERWEIDFWTRTLQVTEQDLREAIAVVGSDVAVIRRFLAGR
jgi:hypothetical protein